MDTASTQGDHLLLVGLKLVYPLREMLIRCVRVLKLDLPYDTTILLLGTTLKSTGTVT